MATRVIPESTTGPELCRTLGVLSHGSLSPYVTYVFKWFMDELGIAHVCEVQPLDSKQVIADVNVILYQFYVAKWYTALRLEVSMVRAK